MSDMESAFQDLSPSSGMTDCFFDERVDGAVDEVFSDISVYESYDQGDWRIYHANNDSLGSDNNLAQDSVPGPTMNSNEQLTAQSTPSTHTMASPEFPSTQIGGQDLQNSLLNEHFSRPASQQEIISARASFQRQIRNVNHFDGTPMHGSAGLPMPSRGRASTHHIHHSTIENTAHGGYYDNDVQGTFGDQGYASTNRILSRSATNAHGLPLALQNERVNVEPLNTPAASRGAVYTPHMGYRGVNPYDLQSSTIANSPSPFPRRQINHNFEQMGSQGMINCESPVGPYPNYPAQLYPDLDEPINQALVIHQNTANASASAEEPVAIAYDLKFNNLQEAEAHRYTYETKVFPGGAQRISNPTLPNTSQYPDLVMELLNSAYNVDIALDNPGVIHPWTIQGSRHNEEKATLVEVQCWKLLHTLIDACAEGPRMAKWGLLGKNAQPKQRPDFWQRFEDLKGSLKQSKSLCKRLVAPDYMDQIVDDPHMATTRIMNNKKLNSKKKVIMGKGKEALKGEQGSTVNAQGDHDHDGPSFEEDDQDEDSNEGPPAKKSKASSAGKARRAPHKGKAQSSGLYHKTSPLLKEENPNVSPSLGSRELPHPHQMRMGPTEAQRGTSLGMTYPGGYGTSSGQMYPGAGPGTVDPRLFRGPSRIVSDPINYPGRPENAYEAPNRGLTDPRIYQMQPMDGRTMQPYQDEYEEDVRDDQNVQFDDNAGQDDYSQ